MSPSSDSSFTHTINCNVFVSFLGEDTRRNFVSHLLGLLKRRGFTTTELESDPSSGESDPSFVDRGISGSKVAIVVISQNFASSAWCVKSLAKILEFHRSGSLAVLIPVFYEMDPVDVKEQSRNRFESSSSATVQTWREALSQLVDIPGSYYSNTWYFSKTMFYLIFCTATLLDYPDFKNDRKADAELICKIADDIWDFLIGSKAVDFCGLVGMNIHMKAMYGLLDLGRKDQVRWIQIVGEQGIGKTELAKYLYEEISHHFDTHLWVDDVSRYGKDDWLREKIARSHRARVLLVIDNVNDTEFILSNDFDSLGPGSRVIINSNPHDYYRTYKRPQDSLNLDYKVVGLEFPQALQLFCLHAFDLQTHPAFGFEDLSRRAVELTGGNPSTIKKLGLRLSGTDKDEWGVILSGYEKLSRNGIIGPNTIVFDSPARVSVSTQSKTINYSEDLVGMNSRMQAVLRLLELESNKEVRVVGIWGTGGIGKTTLAKYAYEGISQKFHTHVFLQIAEDHSSTFCLEKQFLSKAIQGEAFAVRNSKDGLDVMKSALRNQKVLVIVDGVENRLALKEVQEMASWFYPGSRVILTTINESLLLANGVKHVYEVKCLTFDEALQLFYHFALKKKSPSYRITQLSVRATQLVGFLPLALKVTGSMLYGKDEDDWETILQSLEAKQEKGKVEVSVNIKPKEVSAKRPWWRRRSKD